MSSYEDIVNDFQVRVGRCQIATDEFGKPYNKPALERLLEVFREVVAFYNSYQFKSREFCTRIAQLFEQFHADKSLNTCLLEKDIAAVYSDCLLNPKCGIKLSGGGGIWKLVNLQFVVRKETTKQFVESGLLDMLNQLNATTVDSTNTSYTTSIMNIYNTIGTQKEFARLTIKPVIDLVLSLESTGFEAKTYLSQLYNIVACDRERLFEEFPQELDLVKKKFEKVKNQTVRQVLYDMFGTKNAEFVSLLIDYAGTKKKSSFPIDNEVETTVEDVTQFILEKCVEDVDVIESHELQIYDMDIEDYVDFDFIDSDLFKDGSTAKFKLNVTIDFDKKRKKEEKRESELRELSEKSMSIMSLSEKIADSVRSSQKSDNSVDTSAIEMSSIGSGEISGIPMSGIEMSGIQMSGIQMSGIQMSGMEMSGFSSLSISESGGPLEMPSFISAAENAPKVELTENSLLGGSFDIPDSFKEPVTSQKDKKTKKIVNETYQILDKIESADSMIDRKVYIAKDLANKSGPNIVIKYLPIKSTTEFNRCMKEGVNMIRMGRTIQQKKIPLANVFDVFEEEDKEKNKASIRFLCFAMPYYGSGNLQTYLESKKSLDWNGIFSLFKQIVNGLVYLHEQKIAHKNLKLSNIFFVDQDDIVLTDYGLNSDISSQVPEHNSLSNVENIVIEKFQKADIYQAGLILASLCLAMNGQSLNSFASILKEESSLRNSLGNIPEKAKDMVIKLLAKDPNERPSIQQVVNLLDI